MSKDNTADGCIVALIVIAIKGLAVLALYHWLLQPIFGWSYELGFWEALGIGFLLGLIF
jgi:hypothetical protein